MRWFSAVLLSLYLVLVARLTLADPSAGRWAFSLADYSATRLSGGRMVWSRTEVVANVALFVPVGFLLAVVVQRAWVSVALCAVLSAGIELAQGLWLPSRVPSVLDVEHNALGGLVGALVALPVLWVMRKQRLHVAG